MALDSDLLDRFERDWNDALANYEARTTAARMGNVQYDPASRTFAPQEPAPGIAAGIREELLGPLQSKWGTLASLVGGGRTRAPAVTSPGSEWTTAMNLGGGEVARFNRVTGRKEVLSPARPGSIPLSPQDREAADIRRRKLASEIATIDRELTEQRKLYRDAERLPKDKRSINQHVALGHIAVLEARKNALFNTPAPAQTGFAVDPNTIPFGNPVTQEPLPPDTMSMFMGSPMSARPALATAPTAPPAAPQVQVPRYLTDPNTIPLGNPELDGGAFIGDPNNPVVQDEPMAPLPAGPSVSRGIKILSIRRK